jgi:hypothetical protein
MEIFHERSESVLEISVLGALISQRYMTYLYLPQPIKFLYSTVLVPHSQVVNEIGCYYVLLDKHSAKVCIS